MFQRPSEDDVSPAITGDSEVAHYDASNSLEDAATLRAKIARAMDVVQSGRVPTDYWLDTRFDSVAQQEAISHLLPNLRAGHVLQIGGTGLVGLKALVAGARVVTHLSPSQGELDVTRSIAREFGLADRLVSIKGFAEDLAIDSGSIDAVVSEASMHHTSFPHAMGEIERVLAQQGRFGCFEPWKAPLYDLGTSVLGKRDPAVDCRPLDASRLVGVERAFPGLRVSWHGALTRYPMIALSKFGVPISRRLAHSITRVDDAIVGLLPRVQRTWGSSVAITATKR